MLPPSALRAADRLATALMALLRAVSPVAITGSTQALPQTTAETLFSRLSRLVIHLIRLSNFGVRTRAKPAAAAPAPTPPAPPAPPVRRIPAPSLPRRPGWLLAALPDIAPIVAADLRTLLADPAIATLLDAAPHLHRTLRPFLRALGLAAVTPTPSPNATPPQPRHPPPPNPSPPVTPTDPNAPDPSRRVDFDPPEPKPLHATIIAPS